MTVQRFLSLRQSDWRQLEEGLSRLQGGPVGGDEIREFLRLYRQTAADLAFLRGRTPHHPALAEVESLVARAHGVLYRPPDSGLFFHRLLLRDFPQEVFDSWRYLLFALVCFLAGASAGFLRAAQDLEFAYAVVPASMMNAVEQHNLWTGNQAEVRPLLTVDLGTHNLGVAISNFALGMTLGLGTVGLVFYNGLYFGAVLGAASHFQMMGDLLAFVVPHGVLEIPTLWISGAAGLLLGKALLFPGRDSRRQALQLAGTRALRLMVGCLPLLAAAALIEAQFSPTTANWQIRLGVASIGAGLPLWFLLYNRLRNLMSR